MKFYFTKLRTSIFIVALPFLEVSRSESELNLYLYEPLVLLFGKELIGKSEFMPRP